jgi:hypothetical protein
MKTRLKTRPAGCLSDLALDELVASGSPPESAMQQHLSSCETCRDRFDGMKKAQAAFLGEAVARFADAPARGSIARRPANKPSPTPWPVVGGVLALAAGFVLFLRVLPAGRSAGETAIESTSLKGGSHVGFYVKRGKVVMLGAADESLQPGDALRFVYTTPTPSYLAILSLDGAGHASVYSPDPASAVRVEPAVERPLEGSVVLDATLGEETLYGVFCKTAYAIAPLRASLEATRTLHALDGCEVDTLTIHKQAPKTP